jgi:hypothetical protein
MRECNTTVWRPSTAFPYCHLHGHRLVDGLPPGCPYEDEYPGDVLARLQDAAWAQIPQLNLEGFAVLKERYEICSCCRLSREVRERLRRAEARPSTPPRRAPSTGPVAVHLIRGRA